MPYFKAFPLITIHLNDFLSILIGRTRALRTRVCLWKLVFLLYLKITSYQSQSKGVRDSRKKPHSVFSVEVRWSDGIPFCIIPIYTLQFKVNSKSIWPTHVFIQQNPSFRTIKVWPFNLWEFSPVSPEEKPEKERKNNNIFLIYIIMQDILIPNKVVMSNNTHLHECSLHTYSMLAK